jgi:hypothetical protein
MEKRKIIIIIIIIIFIDVILEARTFPASCKNVLLLETFQPLPWRANMPTPFASSMCCVLFLWHLCCIGPLLSVFANFPVHFTGHSAADSAI